MSNEKMVSVAWLVASLGIGTSLLYWEPILRAYLARVPNCRVFTSGKKTYAGSEPLPLEYKVNRYYFTLRKGGKDYPNAIHFVWPGIMLTLLRYKPTVLVISEFGLLSLYGVLFARICRATRILLLVEARPNRSLGPFRGVFRRMVCRASSYILTNNRTSGDYLVNELGVPKLKILQAPYLVSQPGYTRRPHELSAPCREALGLRRRLADSVCIFLFVGKLIERKGIWQLLEGFASLPLRYQARYRLWLVGNGDDRSPLEQQAENCGLATQVVFFGHRSYDDLHCFYENADVFVFPTLHDYRALVGFEALYFGLPVLHSLLDGAVDEIVAEGKNGFAFDPFDIGRLTALLQWFIDNPELREQFAVQSKNRSVEFTVERAAMALADATHRTAAASETHRK